MFGIARNTLYETLRRGAAERRALDDARRRVERWCILLRPAAAGAAAAVEPVSRLFSMSVGAAIVLGAVAGLALGIVVSATTDVPLAPELGLVLGALVGWLSRRRRRNPEGF